MIDLELIPAKYISFKERWADRNERMDDIIDAVNGIWDVDGPDDDQIENRSPNFIQVALEDTAEAASLVPSVRVTPSDPEPEAKDRAVAMERMATSYFDVSQIEVWTIRSIMDLAAYGMCCSVVRHDAETGGPLMEWRDPRTFFPEPGWRTLDSVREGFFARELYVSQLPREWQEAIEEEWPNDTTLDTENIARYVAKKVILIEYFTEDEWLIGALYETGVNRPGGTTTYNPIELDRGENPKSADGHGLCPIIAGQRLALDNEPRGQFDQVIGMMRAHIRLMGMVLDYADQAVYSDVWVKDLIGPMSYGGGAYIQLGPNGSIGRVPPAVSDIQVFRELESLVDSMHLAGRWPKTRPGEIDQAIASAKFVEATAGVMNTVIRTYHLIMKRMLERGLRLMFVTDRQFGKSRMMDGILRNQQFVMKRDKNDIDLSARIRVEYGLGLGHDPAQAMVLGIQAQQSGFVSTEFVQENFDGITDVALERARIDVERLRDMAYAQLLQGLEAGSIPPGALVKIAQARLNGDDIFELFKKYVVDPQEEQLEQQLTSGIDGSPITPGAGPAVPGAPAPAVPPPEALLGALAGGGGGAPPPEAASRLNADLGGGSFISTNTG
jgi:hypothetical protein